jgi:hypothetical protein
MKLFLLVACLQGLAIACDEFIFHHKRGLPKWERISHPFDTFLVVICLSFLYLVDRTPFTENIYYGLATVSCLGVTKDEWIHRKYCSAEEMWLHGVLFIMHPLVLFTAMAGWESARPAILTVACLVFGFFSYEVIYWNVVRERMNRKVRDMRKPIEQSELYEYFGE